MPWQFRVVDGADVGRIFALPDIGVATLGSSRKHADISLNDLYVARVHAEVEIDGPRVVVTAHDSPTGTLVNGHKTRQQEIRHGDVVRMGNSHLRLEDADVAAQEAPVQTNEDVADVAIEFMPDEPQTPTAKAPSLRADGSPAASLPVGNDARMRVASAPGGATPFALAAPHTTAHPPAPETIAPVGVALAPSAAEPLPADRVAELAGHTLAHYQIEEVVAKGHSGVVFRARDLKKDKLVALKVLSPDFPHPDKLDAEMHRFIETFKAILPLRHPHLVAVLGVGKTGPYTWLASEFVESVSVPELIERLGQRSTIDWRRGFRVALHIGQALAFAHQRRLVHRNITARNLLWRSSDKTAKLADLGLAAALEGAAIGQTLVRDKLQAELVYVSPEQTEPNCFVDGVCDIYSLGALVYALLTGRFPCAGATQAETIRKIRTEIPVRPSKLQPSIPKGLDAIVMKMLAKHQEDRFQTASDLVGELEEVAAEVDMG